MINTNTDTDVNESQFSDLVELYEITTPEQIHEFLGDIIILNRYQNNFDYLYDRTVDVAALCWNNKDPKTGDKLQHTLIPFKVDIEDTITHAIPLCRFMISLAFIRPIVPYLDDVQIDDFYLHDYITVKSRKMMQDSITAVLRQHGHGIKEIQTLLARYSLDLKELLMVFSYADLQLFTADNLFLDHYRDSPEIRDINNTYYPPETQSVDIIEENAKKYDVLAKIMTDRGNPFFVANKFTKILKPKQMEEMYIHFGQIPDGKNLIPVIMNGNGFNQGYHDIDVLYAGAIAARVPDIMNEEYMGSAGYFNRNLMILTYGTLSKTVYDCGTRNKIKVVIDETELEMKVGRFYAETPDGTVLKVLHNTDTHLIGKTLYFRSPCKCNLNEDVCHLCYGTVALKVGELKGGYIYTTELLTNIVSKNILSAKHLLKANAEKIEISDAFEKYFTLDRSAVVPKDDKRFDIFIPDDYQDNISEELTFYAGKEMSKITISHYANIHLPDAILDKCKDVMINDVLYHKITSFKVIELGGSFCNITPINIMMTQKYMNIMKLFESDIATKYTNVDDVVSALTKLLYKTIPILSVHGEIIISKLLRDASNKLLRPNWLEPEAPYQMLRLKTALQNIESPSTALAFEQTRHHLLHSIFDDRNAIKRVGPRSFADYMFGEEVY